jgi:acyl carrier protein
VRIGDRLKMAEDIFEKVQETLVDALGVDDDEVTPEATLIGDLGAESIDFLDIVFRLEKNFDIKIPRGELFPENLAAADSGFIADGVVTTDGIAQLREKMPHADIDAFANDPQVSKLPDLFTVNMICRFIATRVG